MHSLVASALPIHVEYLFSLGTASAFPSVAPPPRTAHPSFAIRYLNPGKPGILERLSIRLKLLTFC